MALRFCAALSLTLLFWPFSQAVPADSPLSLQNLKGKVPVPKVNGMKRDY
jgi:hypothetical protein